MIRVTIELLPHGREDRAETIGTVEIINDGYGSETTGHYDVKLMKSPRYAKTPGVWRKGRVTNFPRLTLGPYDLLYRALRACVGTRNPPERPPADDRTVRLAGPLFDRFDPETVDVPPSPPDAAASASTYE